MTNSYLAGSIVSAVIITVFVVMATLRKPNKLFKKKPRQTKSFRITVKPEELKEKITRFANQNKYRVEGISEEDHCIVLGTEMGLLHWGFFFPIYYSQEQGEVKIEMGIESKAYQWGPVVNNAFKKFTETLEKDLTK